MRQLRLLSDLDLAGSGRAGERDLVELHRERRLRERLKAAAALPAILGTSLKLGDVLERLGEAVRPSSISR